MISHRHRCIFVHIPKTAGCSIEAVFGIGDKFVNPEQPGDERHRRLGEYRRLFPGEFGGYFKFTIVRNPWDMLVSRYSSRREKRLRSIAFLDDRIAQADAITDIQARKITIAKLENKRAVVASSPDLLSFEEWMAHHADKWSGKTRKPEKQALHPPGTPRGQLLEYGVDMEPHFDFVGRFERLNEDFQVVCERLGIQAQLPHVNASKHRHYTTYYDDYRRDLVAHHFKHDIERFGYRFGG